MAYDKYYNTNMPPLSIELIRNVIRSPIRSDFFLTLEQAKELVNPGYQQEETGFCMYDDCSYAVACLTPMPKVTPDMWDWWFGWHGDTIDKYKLWHPKAHLTIGWEDKRMGEVAYIGRNSVLTEYIGDQLSPLKIQFIPPEKLGLPSFKPGGDQVFICARIGMPDKPVDHGWLVHQVRKVSGGSEMRSRFWMGGKFLGCREEGFLGNVASKILQTVIKVPQKTAHDLLVHCSEEMNHLAAFLPDMYKEYGPK